MALLYALPALTNSLQGFYRGMGKMTTTLIGTCLQAGLRAAAAAVLAVLTVWWAVRSIRRGEAA